MSRRYDSRTTTFSPEGRLFQVEYALEAINNASSTIGILASDGIVLAADKLVASKLLDPTQEKEKLFVISEHIICAAAGWTADSNILLNKARLSCERYLFRYEEPEPTEHLVVDLCDHKQGYTQFGGLRPFGVSFLIAGYDKEAGFQLYYTDPAGNYGGWKAAAMGQNNQSAQSILKEDMKDNINLSEALELAAKVLARTSDSPNPSGENVEFATITFDAEKKKPVIKFLPEVEIDVLMKKAAALKDQNEQ